MSHVCAGNRSSLYQRLITVNFLAVSHNNRERLCKDYTRAALAHGRVSSNFSVLPYKRQPVINNIIIYHMTFEREWMLKCLSLVSQILIDILLLITFTHAWLYQITSN